MVSSKKNYLLFLLLNLALDSFYDDSLFFCTHHESRLFPYILLRNINNKVVFYVFSEKMFIMLESLKKFFL